MTGRLSTPAKGAELHAKVDMMLLYDLASLAIDDADARMVLGDYVLETEWFDPRVMQLLWPIGKAPRHGWRSKKKRDRAKVDKVAFKAGYPDMFVGCAARPTTGAWARAVVAVCLFRGWRTKKWPMLVANQLALVARWRSLRVGATSLPTFRQIREQRMGAAS